MKNNDFDPREDSPWAEVKQRLELSAEPILKRIAGTPKSQPFSTVDILSGEAKYSVKNISLCFLMEDVFQVCCKETSEISSALAKDLANGDEQLAGFNTSFSALIGNLKKWQRAVNKDFGPRAAQWSEDFETSETYFTLGSRVIDDERIKRKYGG